MEITFVDKFEKIVKKYFPDCILRVQFPDEDLYPSFMNENTTYEEFNSILIMSQELMLHL